MAKTITMTTAAVPLFLWSCAVLIASGDSVLVDVGSLGLADAVDGRVWCELLLRLLRLRLLVEAAVPVVEALLLLPGVVDGVVCGVVVLWLPPLLLAGGVDMVEGVECGEVVLPAVVLLSQSVTSQLQLAPSVPSICTRDAGHVQHVSKRLHELFWASNSTLYCRAVPFAVHSGSHASEAQDTTSMSSQLSRTPGLMSITELGITSRVRLVLANARAPSAVTVVGRSMNDSSWHPSNARSGMVKASAGTAT